MRNKLYISNSYRRLIFFFLLIIVLLPIFILSYDEYVDQFIFSTVGLAETCYQEGRLIIHPYAANEGWQNHANDNSVRVVPVLIFVILRQASGLSLNDLVFLPFVGLLIILLSYSISKNLIRSNYVACLFAITMGYNLFPSVNIYYISVGISLLLLFLIIWIKLVEKNYGDKCLIILLLTVFIAAYLSYYTAEFLIICFSFGLLCISFIMRRIGIEGSYPRLASLTLFFLVCFNTFDSIIYFYLQNFSIEESTNIFSSYFNYVLNFLKDGAVATQEYRPYLGYTFIAYVDLVHWVIIIFPTFLYSLFLLKKLWGRKTKLTRNLLFFSSLVIVGFSQVLVYSTIGYGVHTWTLFFTLSLASIYVLYDFVIKKRLQSNREAKPLFLVMILTIMLLIPSLNIAKFVIRLEDPVQPNGFHFHSIMQATVSWVATYFPDGYVKTDSRTAGQLFMELTKIGKADFVYPTRLGQEVKYLYSIDYLASYNIFRKSKPEVLVLSHKFETRSFHAGLAWDISPPLGNAIFYLNCYHSLNKVYDDGYGLIYKYQK